MRALILLAIVQAVLSASLVPCPEQCQCSYVNESLDATCENFDFLNKLISKQYTSITRLKIIGPHVDMVNPKLKYLKNLHTFDVSHNTISLMHLGTLKSLSNLNLKNTSLKSVHFSDLPKNLEHLDLSSNYISEISRDWTYLQQLKTIDLANNPISCDCHNALIYKDMLKQNIQFSSEITCGKSKDVKTLGSINCSALDLMLNDAVPIIDDNNELDQDEMQQDEPEEASDVFDSNQQEQNIETEGSGDEGSGFVPPQIIEAEEPENETETGSGMGIIIPELPKACTENCSEPNGLEEEEGASPLPDIKEQLNILNGDLFNHQHEETTTIPDVTTTTVSTSPVVEVLLTKEAVDVLEGSKTDKDNYDLTENTKLGRASIGNDSNKTVYYVIGAIFIALVCLTIYLVKRKNRMSMNRRKQIPEENYGDELKPLEKKSIKPLNEKPIVSPDHVPLMNGNGNGTSNGKDVEFKEVDLRPKVTNTDLLTPKRERVTIKETELLDSIPKTPLLVHREVSSDGQIVLTPVE